MNPLHSSAAICRRYLRKKKRREKDIPVLMLYSMSVLTSESVLLHVSAIHEE
jgi:hypothetical protein